MRIFDNEDNEVPQGQDGYFYITDRKKDIIIKGGENISPRVIRRKWSSLQPCPKPW